MLAQSGGQRQQRRRQGWRAEERREIRLRQGGFVASLLTMAGARIFEGGSYSTSVFFFSSGDFKRSLTLDFLPAFTSTDWVLDIRPLDSKSTV
jgi:hypothetical protein